MARQKEVLDGVRVDGVEKNVLTVRLTTTKARDFWFLLRSDAHHDHPDADHNMELRHLREAVERGAGIFDIGDLFDAMQSAHDKRRSYDELRPELRATDYIDRLIEYNAEFLRPFRDHFIAISPGNHERSVRQHQNICLTSALQRQLGCAMLPYEGYVRFLVNLSGRRGSVVKYHHHGFGMAQRSKGTLTADIISSQRPDANIVHLGHNHNNYIVRLPRERLNAKGRVYTDCCWHIRTGGYKPTSNSGDGWGVERGHGPCALGAAWLRIRVSKTGNFLDIVVDAFHAS